jgi:5-(carboxyamino)imidazole ribonucleotide mutase
VVDPARAHQGAAVESTKTDERESNIEGVVVTTNAGGKLLVAVVMGSKSDWDTMRHSVETLDGLGIQCEARALSAHRTPDAAFEYASGLEARGVEVLIAAAGGAAHLGGVMAAKTRLPVLGVPMESKISGIDSLLSMVQMPAGIPVATFAIGKAGAINAALFAAAILANRYDDVRAALEKFRADQTKKVLESSVLK